MPQQSAAVYYLQYLVLFTWWWKRNMSHINLLFDYSGPSLLRLPLQVFKRKSCMLPLKGGGLWTEGQIYALIWSVDRPSTKFEGHITGGKFPIERSHKEGTTVQCHVLPTCALHASTFESAACCHQSTTWSTAPILASIADFTGVVAVMSSVRPVKIHQYWHWHASSYGLHFCYMCTQSKQLVKDKW